MLPWEAFEAALRRFQSHRLQMGLTLAGLAVGTGSIVIVVSLGLTGRGYVMSQIEGVGSQLIWATYEGTVTGGVSRKLEDHILDSDARAVAEHGEIFSGVTPLLILHGRTPVLARAADLTILGATANYPQVRKNLRLLRGRFLDEEDVERRANVCVVNRHLYEEVFGGEGGDAAERTIRTLGLTFEVVGEFEEPVDTLGQGDVTPETIFVPITVGWLFTPTRRVDTLFAEVRRFGDIPRAMDLAAGLLQERHHRGSQYKVDSMTSVIRVASAISWGLLVVFVLIAAVSVVVGGVGTMNVLLASVEERTREIGLRKSVGARRGDIRAQFLAEALVLGVAGSGAGVGLGLAVPLLARSFLPQAGVAVSPLAALLAFFFSCGVTLVFGVVPAHRAASLEPVEALRHE